MSNILHSQGRVDVLTHVSGNLRRLRLATGMSQTALADVSGISRRMIVGVEAGDANISLSSLDKLAVAMGVDFVELVRDPSRETRAEINEVTWRGRQPTSAATLLCSAPASRETQMWLWSLGPGDSYVAEPDPDGWHEMLFVIEGMLRLDRSGDVRDYGAGEFVTYSTARHYSYANAGKKIVRFVRNVVS